MGNYTYAMIYFWIRDVILFAQQGTRWSHLHGGIKFLEPDSGTETVRGSTFPFRRSFLCLKPA